MTSLQTQAEELAGQINADDQTLAQLDQSYDAGRIAYAQLQTRRVALAGQMAASAQAVATARHALQQDAILAYLTGGAPIINRPDELGAENADITLAYASIVAGGAKADEDRYQATLDTEAKQRAAMAATIHDESVTLSDIAAYRTQAAATLASQQAALAQVKGQLAVAVAAVQAQQQAAEQSQVQAQMAAQGNPPPAGSGTAVPAQVPATVVPVATPAPVDPPSSIDPVTFPPTTAPPTTAPPTTDPPTTDPPTTDPPTTAPPPPSSGSSSPPAQAPGVSAVLAYAEAQLGKPYQWGGAGPGSFDCSGLVMMAWEQAGIYFPHLAQDQYDLTVPVPFADMIPGDLVFYGTPNDVYHVGIYVGNGNMIAAPETGQDVSVQNIYWDGLLSAGRVTTSS